MSTKIKSIEAKTYQGKITGHSITLEDGASGYLDDKGSDKDLKQGESVNYLVAVKLNKKGDNYNLLTIKRDGTAPAPVSISTTNTPTSQQSNTAGKYTYSKSQQEWKAQAAIDAMGFMIEAVASGKIDWPQIEEKQRQACNILWNEIDEIFSKG